jgi:leader peptidase (prepilin peptidase) / N-methyltransferase
MIVIGIYVFLFGLVIGSFLNVCIYRIPLEQSIITPPSHCTKCNQRLKPIDLIPVVSYIFQKGKCRYCKTPYSARYAIVEFLTALIFVITYLKYVDRMFEFIIYALFMSIMIAVFFIDYDHKIIPDQLVICGLVLGVSLYIYSFFHEVLIFGDRNWWNPLIGMISGSGFLFIVALIGMIVYKSDDVMGMGDVKLFAPIGLVLGWKMTIVAMFFSVVSAGFISVVLMLLKVKSRKDAIPFGPFIVIGFYATLIFGQRVLNLYLLGV